MLGNKPFAFEERIRREDGQYRWFLAQFNRCWTSRPGHSLVSNGDRHRRSCPSGRKNSQRKSGAARTIDRDSMFEDIVGSSEALRKVLRQVAKVRLRIPQF